MRKVISACLGLWPGASPVLQCVGTIPCERTTHGAETVNIFGNCPIDNWCSQWRKQNCYLWFQSCGPRFGRLPNKVTVPTAGPGEEPKSRGICNPPVKRRRSWENSSEIKRKRVWDHPMAQGTRIPATT